MARCGMADVESGTRRELQLHLLDVGRDEFVADIVAADGKVAQTGLYTRWSTAATDGRRGWSALIGCSTTSARRRGHGSARRPGMIASRAGGPLLAGADGALLMATMRSVRLAGLRRQESRRGSVWSVPRVLLRRPYGKGSDPIESFAFEEFAGGPVHDELSVGQRFARHRAATRTRLSGAAAGTWSLATSASSTICRRYRFVRDGGT